MASSARAASPRKTRKARTAPTVQASTNFIIFSTDEDNLIDRQAQRLSRDFGLSSFRARIADITASLGRMQALVLGAVISAGPHGVTTNEAATELRMERGTVQPRTSELRRFGLIQDSGKRRLNANGKKAIVWIASQIKKDLPHG